MKNNTKISLITMLATLIVVGCATPNPSNYSNKYYYVMTELQKKSILVDMALACTEVDLLEPDTVAHKECVRDRINERDDWLREKSIARASAPVNKTYVKTTNTTKVKQDTCVGC